MFDIYLYAIASVLVVSLLSLIGAITLSLREVLLNKYVFVLVSLAVGALLGDAFIHLIPEAFAEFSNPLSVSLLVMAGILVFFILEKAMHWHHHGIDQDHAHVSHVGKMVIISDGLHNFIDGIIIGASYLVSIPVGIATTVAVILHEIPQEIGDFGVLIHAGYTKKRALWMNFLSALTSFIGLGLVLIIGPVLEPFTMGFVPFAAGGFIYIAMSDLIPELHKTKKLNYTIIQLAAVLVGVVAMLLLLVIE